LIEPRDGALAILSRLPQSSSWINHRMDFHYYI